MGIYCVFPGLSACAYGVYFISLLAAATGDNYPGILVAY